MQSSTRRARALPSTMVLLALLCGACAAGPRYTTIPAAFDCGKRIPPGLRAKTNPPPIPTEDTQGQWGVFGDAAVGKIEVADDKKDTALWIVDQCEAEKQKVIDTLNKPTLMDRLAFWR